MDVNLASQTHQAPHVGFPQSEPVTIVIIAKTHPIGAKLLPISGASLILKIIFKIEKNPISTKQPSAINYDGT